MSRSRLDDIRDQVASVGGRLYAGCVSEGFALAEREQALLVIGPPRSGKTSGVVVPNVLCAPGPVVVTSTKADIIAATVEARSAVGRCWLFDPTGSSGDPVGTTRLRWSPAASASTWDRSLLLARAMTSASRPSGRHGESAHWTERAEALIAPLLLAANLRGGGIEEVLRWVLRQETGAAAAALLSSGMSLGADVLAGVDATDPREQSGIWSSAAGVLAAYRSETVLDNSDPANMAPESLVGSRDTVYICAPARHQDLVAPLVVAFLEQVRGGAVRGQEQRAPGAPAHHGSRRGGEHRSDPRSPRPGGRGRQPRRADTGMSPGPVSGQAAMGSRRRRVLVAVRSKARPSGDRRPIHSRAGLEALR